MARSDRKSESKRGYPVKDSERNSSVVEPDRVKRDYAKLCRRLNFVFVGILALLLTILYFRDRLPRNELLLYSTVVFLASGIFFSIYNRCPSCKKYLGKIDISKERKFCSNCGAELS